MAQLRPNRFGKMEAVISLKQPKTERKNMYPRGYVEIGNKMYKVTVSQGKKDGVYYWVTMTEVMNQGSQFTQSRAPFQQFTPYKRY